MAKHDRILPSKSGFSHCSFCSSVPYRTSVSMFPVSGAVQLNTCDAAGKTLSAGQGSDKLERVFLTDSPQRQNALYPFPLPCRHTPHWSNLHHTSFEGHSPLGGIGSTDLELWPLPGDNQMRPLTS